MSRIGIAYAPTRKFTFLVDRSSQRQALGHCATPRLLTRPFPRMACELSSALTLRAMVGTHRQCWRVANCTSIHTESSAHARINTLAASTRISSTLRVTLSRVFKVASAR
ncbi:hypothetical protein IG631_04051 [Alternaria alternata]|nr:hypothetical protein IG631_04051 [Alternaria alternata]